MFKKAMSLLLSLILAVMTLSTTTVNVCAADTTYVVAGISELCGNLWDGDPISSPDNIMTYNGDGTYQKVYTNVAVMEGYQFKVVENSSFGEMIWHGIDGGDQNFIFNVVSVCDVTITFDPATLKITVTGAGVEIPTQLNVESMRTVGNGDGNWLNGVSWDPVADKNLMTEVSEKVYEITYTDLGEFDNYQVKFVANGFWDDNWGGVYQGSGVKTDAVYNSSDNITIEVPYELADVTLRLDLTNFDYTTKTGATFTVTVTDKNAKVPNGLEEDADGNYYFYTDGVVDTSKNGLICYEDWGKFVYLEEGRWATDKVTYAEYGGGKFLVDRGVVATSVNGLHQDPANTDTWYFLSAGQVQSHVTDLVLYDGAWFYLENGIKATNRSGIVDYDGGKFLLAHGQLQSDVTTLYHNEADKQWYYVVGGQVQTQVTDLVSYDGAWFYVVNGILANDYVGIVDYDGGKFYVANGQVATSVNGLQLNTADGKWYLIGGGQVQTQYTGEVEYNGETFNIVNGVVQ